MIQRWKTLLGWPFRVADSRLTNVINNLVARRIVRLAPIREFAFPYDQIEVDYSNSAYGFSHLGRVGFFEVKNLFLHTGSGLAFIAPFFRAQPLGIMESGLEDYQLLAEQSKTYRAFAGFDAASTPEIEFDRPAFLFNIFKNKSNYYHFFIDNALRLITFLEYNKRPVTILTAPHNNKYMKEFFALVEQIYPCKIEARPNKSEHYRIRSPLIFMEPVLRNIGNFSANEEWVLNRIRKDPPVNLGGEDPSLFQPFREHYLTPKSWELESTRTVRFKNNTLLFLPSQTSIDCFDSFISQLETMGFLQQKTDKVVYITRASDSQRGRTISNEKSLLDAIPEAKPVNFGDLSLTEQISTARNADVLIGAIGAGLTNALFMRKNATVIEIVPATYSIPASNHIENICALRHLKHHRIYSSPLDKNRCTKVSPMSVAAVIRLSSTET